MESETTNTQNLHIKQTSTANAYEFQNNSLLNQLNQTNNLNSLNNQNNQNITINNNNNLKEINVPEEDNTQQNFELIYSPRTTYSKYLENEEIYFTDLTINFDPITIKIVKKHFKERLGILNRMEFISILKNHLLSWHSELPDRERVLVKLLDRLFSEIDLNDNGTLEWAEFTNYIIHNSNSLNNRNDADAFRLRFYSLARKTIDVKDISENIPYAFYIEKHNLIGIVDDGKYIIQFYDANNFKKLPKCQIDLKEIQKDIDDLDDRDLDERAMQKKKQQEENLKKIKAAQAQNKRKFLPKIENRNDKSKAKKKDGENAKLGVFNKTASGLMLDEQNEDGYKKDFDKANTYYKNDKKNRNMNPNGKNTGTKSVFKKLTTYCTFFIAEYDVLLVSASNKRISAWKFISGEFKNANSIKEPPNIDKNYFSCSILVTTLPQYCMAWDSMQRILYTGQKDGKILKWDLLKPTPCGILDVKKSNPKDKDDLNYSSDETGRIQVQPESEKDLKKGGMILKRKYEKRDAVSFILVISKIQILAASYYNGLIVLWDTLLMEQRKVYKDHKTGIYHLSYDSQKNLLFSCGFDHNIYVYDPYISFHVYKLQGHYGSINTIICNEKDNELISLDIFGNIKVWDSQMLSCFQTISISEHTESISKNTNYRMIHLKKQKKIMVYGPRIVIYETDKSLNPELADDQIIFSSCYDKFSKCIISFSLRKIKMWNPFTGKVKKVYDDPMGNEITALSLDKNLKRIFIGDNTGNLKCFNMKNGKFLKNLTSHENEISIMLHSLDLSVLITCSIDNTIKIHEDKDIFETSVLKEIKIANNQVNAIALIEKHKRIAIGFSTGIIKFYDIEHFRYDSDLNSDNLIFNDEITSLYYFIDTDVLLSSHSSGLNKITFIPPHSLKFNVVFEFYNTDLINKNSLVPVTCIDFDYSLRRLYHGDQLGILTCLDFSLFLEEYETFNANNYNNNSMMHQLTLDYMKRTKDLKIPTIFRIEAHKDSIKHLFYSDVSPNFIITTSHDLRIKLFSADDGKYFDELKQISNKYPPIPIGIKYRGYDPISKTVYDKTVWRKDLHQINIKSVDDIQGENINDYSNKITLFNAKEKLLSHVKIMNMKGDTSNKWNFQIDLDRVKEDENNQLNKLFEIVKIKEPNILKTEMLMQTKSIYNETYKPLFINEMDEAAINNFAQVLSQKLRNVKLAITRANLGNSKFNNRFDDDKERTKKKPYKTDIEEELNPPKKKKKNNLNPINVSKKMMDHTKYKTAREGSNPFKIFEMRETEFKSYISDLNKPFAMLSNKVKLLKRMPGSSSKVTGGLIDKFANL